MVNFNVPTQHDVTEQKVGERHMTGFQALAPALGCIYPTASWNQQQGGRSVCQISARRSQMWFTGIKCVYVCIIHEAIE